MNLSMDSNIDLQPPPIIVISLPDSHARRTHIAGQLERLRLKFRLFDAHRPTEYPPTYERSTRLRIYGNDLTLGEIGCYLSHFAVWRQLANSNHDVWCVLEDDVVITDEFTERLVQAMLTSTPWGIMRLYDGGSAGTRTLQDNLAGIHLQYHRKQPGGLLGYLVRRHAAIRLIEFGQQIVHPVDDMINRHWEHRIPMLSTSPPSRLTLRKCTPNDHTWPS